MAVIISPRLEAGVFRRAAGINICYNNPVIAAKVKLHVAMPDSGSAHTVPATAI
ncbi:MAG: hypothetical protein MZV63_16195 [Marinilabiliales bacterium]|nr:hypothetical protein [Marinilabiliales bacterium]